MSNQIFHFSNSGISSGQRFYLKDDVSGIFLRNLNIDSNFPVVASNLIYNTGNQTISGIKSFNNGLATTYISGVSGSNLNIIGYSRRNVNISGANDGDTLDGKGGDINLMAGNSPKFAGKINLIAGTGSVLYGDEGINLYAGPSPKYDGNNNIFGNIRVNYNFTAGNPVITPKTISIYRSGNVIVPFPSPTIVPSQLLGVLIDNDKVDVNNGMVLQVSGVNVTPEIYVNTTSDQNISGIKNFYSRPTVNGTGVLLSGEASAVTLPDTIVYTTGNQNISGVKNFYSIPTVNGTGVFLSGGNILSTQISDSSSAGRALLTGATVQAQRTALDIFVSAANLASFPASGNFQRIYLALDTQKTYVWNGVGYTEVSPNTHTRAGAANINVGETALASASLTGSNNTAVGVNALAINTSGGNNAAYGTNALANNVIGSNNTAFGAGALQLSNANNNTAYGTSALKSNQNGVNNVAVGISSLQACDSYNNTAIGQGSLFACTSGNSNSALGLNAGATVQGGVRNTLLGTQSDVDAQGRNNCVVIGANTTSPAVDGSLAIGGAGGNAMTGLITSSSPTDYLRLWLNGIAYMAPIQLQNATARFVLDNDSRYVTGGGLLVYTTGNQNISGIKNFYSRPTVNGIGVLLSGEVTPGGLPNTIVYTTGNQNISGTKTFDVAPILSGNPFITGVNLSSYVTTGQTGVFYPRNNPSGFITNATLNNVVYTTGDQTISGVKGFDSRPTVNGTGVLLIGEVTPGGLPNTIVYTTGNQNIFGVKTFENISGDFASFNNIELNSIDLNSIDVLSLSGVDVSIISGNVILTNRPTVNGIGVLLSGEAPGLGANIVYTTGNQNISGTKNFYSRPTVNGTGVLLSGEAAALGQNVVYTTGNQSINGLKDFTTLPRVNGNNLVDTYQNQTIYGDKFFLNNIGVSGLSDFRNVKVENIDKLFLSGLDMKVSSIDKLFISGIDMQVSSIDQLYFSGVDILLTGNSSVNLFNNIYISGNPVSTGVFVSAANLAAIQALAGNFQRLYLALDTQKTYVWNGIGYTEISPNTHTRAGAANINVGETALASASLTGSNNTAVGANALAINTSGGNNAAYGANALANNVIGNWNSAFGVNALANSNADSNTAFGGNALKSNKVGVNNVAIGISSLQACDSYNNTAVGQGSLFSCTSGNSNAAFGLNAGVTITTGIRNTLLGTQSDVDAQGRSNCVVIGNLAVSPAVDGSLAIGGTAGNAMGNLVTTSGGTSANQDLIIYLNGTRYRIALKT